MLETYLGFNNPLTPKYKKSKGIFLIDSNNIKWLDLFSNYSSLPLGHNFDELENCFQSKNYLFFERSPLCAFNHEEVNEFKEELENLVPNNFKNISFAENGGLANEQVMKSFLYKANKENKNIRFYVFKGSYHGIAGLSLLLTNSAESAKLRTNFIKPFKNISVINLHNINSKFFNELNTIHVLFIEPLKCTKGDFINTQEEKEIINFFKKNSDFFLVYDEIQTGLYPLMNPWGYQFFELPEPDVISFGKRFQVSGFVSNESLSDVFINSAPKLLSSTFDGSLIDLVRGTFYMRYLRDYFLNNEEMIINNFEKLGNIFTKIGTKYEGEFERYGTYMSLKFTSKKAMENCSNFFTSKYILHNPTLPKTIRFRAPVNIAIEDIYQIEKRLNY